MWILKRGRRAGYLFGLLAVLTGCGEDRGGCGEGTLALSEYQIDEYSMDFSVFTPKENLAGESADPYIPTTVINPLDFALRLDGVVDWQAHSGNSSDRFRFRWLADAYACSPAPYQIPLQRLLRYEITSTASFGADFPPGSDIATLFLEEYRDAPNASSILPFVEGGIIDDEIPPMHQTLRLSAMPSDVEHVFTVTIELDDGDYYQFVSPTVTFDLMP